MFKVESTNENICKGDTLNITCSAEGRPDVHTYQLFQNNILVHTSNSLELFWSNVSTIGGEVMYTCEANNTASTANTTRTVTVNGEENYLRDFQLCFMNFSVHFLLIMSLYKANHMSQHACHMIIESYPF